MNCKTIRKTVITDSQNSFILELSAVDSDGNNSPASLASIQSVSLDLGVLSGQITVLRNSGSPAIDWWSESLSTGEMLFMLGGWVGDSDIEPGEHPTQLITFEEPGRPGTYWATFENRELIIKVVDE